MPMMQQQWQQQQPETQTRLSICRRLRFRSSQLQDSGSCCWMLVFQVTHIFRRRQDLAQAYAAD